MGYSTWGSVVGSLLLLLRKGLAFHVFLAVFISMIVTMVHNCVLTDGLKAMGGSVGALIFSAVIMVIGVLLIIYARAMRQRGVLR